jgi:dihydroneopterin aldolase
MYASFVQHSIHHLGQRFKVDLTAELDLSKAGKTDDLSYTINYAELYSWPSLFSSSNTP